MPDGLFIFFAALTLGAALLLVLSRNAVTSAMGMILALVGGILNTLGSRVPTPVKSE